MLVKNIVTSFLIGTLVFIIVLNYEGKQENKQEDKQEFISKNNCKDLEKLYVCENKLALIDLVSNIRERIVSKEDISRIEIKPYTYVSKGIINADSNISSHYLKAFDQNNNLILEITRLDDTKIVEEIKQSLNLFSYSLSE